MTRKKYTPNSRERIQLQLGEKLKREVMELCEHLDTNVSRVIREQLRVWAKKQRRRMDAEKAA